MADRWFIVPVTGSGTESDAYRPKYGENADGYSGNRKDFSADKWSDLPWYPNEMYVVRIYGDTATLDSIQGNDDAYTHQEYDNITKSDVADYLNDKFNESRTFEEWLNHFSVGG